MKNYWYIAASSKDLGKNTISRKILDQPLVLFRNENGIVSALLDRCAHRNARLSGGKVINGRIRCPYHGWEFNSQGKCAYIPSLCEGEKIPVSAVTNSFPVIEQDGYIWVWAGDRMPDNEEKPFQILHYKENGWQNFKLRAKINNTVDNIIENFIDSPHTGYIHKGIFRNPASQITKSSVKIVSDGVIIDTEEENKGDSLLAALLVGKEQKQVHQDRFIMPSLVQVAYSIGSKKHMIGYHFCTPADEFTTYLNVCVTWHFGWLNPLVKKFVPIIGQKILNQDVEILNVQGSVIRKYGEHFTSAPADTANIWIKNMRQKAREGQEIPSLREKQVDFRL
jgi:phenylpropionate dioxygenase-like ring-hydroxylating dioxygenase large terminal subunit